MRTLLAQPSANTREGFRDMVLLSVLYDTGARVQELVDIRINHIRLEKTAVVILHGKGNKARQVPIMPYTVEASCKDILPDENFRDWNVNINIMSFLNSLC